MEFSKEQGIVIEAYGSLTYVILIVYLVVYADNILLNQSNYAIPWRFCGSCPAGNWRQNRWYARTSHIQVATEQRRCDRDVSPDDVLLSSALVNTCYLNSTSTKVERLQEYQATAELCTPTSCPVRYIDL